MPTSARPQRRIASPSTPFFVLLLAACALPLAACAGGGGGAGTPPVQARVPHTVLFASEDGRSLPAAKEDGSVECVIASAFTVFDSYESSPDGRWVAFVADRDFVGRNDLLVADLADGAPTRVATGALGTRGVLDFRWAPDGQSLVYRAESVLGRPHLYRVDRDASADPTCCAASRAPAATSDSCPRASATRA